jgi:hypothetical protein
MQRYSHTRDCTGMEDHISVFGFAHATCQSKRFRVGDFLLWCVSMYTILQQAVACMASIRALVRPLHIVRCNIDAWHMCGI